MRFYGEWIIGGVIGFIAGLAVAVAIFLSWMWSW
jgi:hypothetical protein